MSRYRVEWYIDIPGLDGIREIEVEAEDEDKAGEIAFIDLSEHLTMGEVNEVSNA